MSQAVQQELDMSKKQSGSLRNKTEKAAQFITFAVNNEEYAIDILSVLEIKGWIKMTQLPNQPEYLCGVLNLRGSIIPIIDLRYRFGEGKTEASNTNVIIIVSIAGSYVGALVDAVTDILAAPRSEIQNIPDIGYEDRENFLSGMITKNDRMVSVLELDKLKAGVDLSIIEASADNEVTAMS